MVKTWLSRTILTSLTAALLVSCSARKFFYKWADWYFLKTANDHIELTDPQEELFEKKLDVHLNWHKNEELPKYEKIINQLRSQAADGLSDAEVTWFWSEVMESWERIARRIADDGALILADVGPAQIEHLSKEFKKRNEKPERALKMPEASYVKEKTAELTKHVAQWIGVLQKPQRDILEQYVREGRQNQNARFENRIKTQQELLQLLRVKTSAAKWKEHILIWWLEPEKKRTPEYQRIVKEQNAALKKMILRLDASLSPKQRTHFLAELQKLSSDLHQMSKSR